MPSTQAHNTQFFLVISQIPAEWRWQDLKDLVRNIATHGVRTHVIPNPSGSIGGVRVQLYDEARALYTYLCTRGIAGVQVHVILYDITQSQSQPKFLDSNGRYDQRTGAYVVSRMLEDRALWETTPEQRYADPYSPPPTTLYPPIPGNMMPTPGPILQPTRSASSMPYALPLPAMLQYPQTLQSPIMGGNAQIPINVANGVVRTEKRGIFIKGLNYEISQSEVKAKFGAIGNISRCELAKDQHGRSKGYAIVIYSRVEDANTAIWQFNGRDWRRRTLQVRELKEGETVRQYSMTASKPRGPVIANGTMGSRRAQNESRGSSSAV